jgi:hypothetical protein
MPVEHFDVLIVGAGLSGIAAGYYLQRDCPARQYAILEGRSDLGGTWDLFRYPGIRSDSDMFTLGYSFRPWKDARAIADGPAILNYLRETAREFGSDRHIRFQHRVRSASWSSPQARWTVEAEVDPLRQPARYTGHFLYLCSGYQPRHQTSSEDSTTLRIGGKMRGVAGGASHEQETRPTASNMNESRFFRRRCIFGGQDEPVGKRLDHCSSLSLDSNLAQASQRR